jgi:hypothetical protein
MGDALYGNVLLLGVAWQMGLVPLSLTAIEKAIELNGAAIEQNRQAFLWGRRAAHDPQSMQLLTQPASPAARRRISQNLDETIEPPPRVPDRLSGRALRPTLPCPRRARTRRRIQMAIDGPERGSCTQLFQVAGSKGRVRGGTALCRPIVHPAVVRRVRGRLQTALSSRHRRCSPDLTPQPAEPENAVTAPG